VPVEVDSVDRRRRLASDGVEKAIAAAKEFAGERDVTAGQIGSQALELGLIDQVVMNAAAAGGPDRDPTRRPGHPPLSTT
jgi:hypothetical protein